MTKKYIDQQIPDFKICNECKEDFPSTNFWASKSAKDGLQAKCKKCNRTKNKEWYKENHAEERIKDKERKLIRSFGITQTEFDQMVEDQNHTCAICSSPTPGGRGAWSVDHNHQTGKVRALLCMICNVTLGHYELGWGVKIPDFDYYLELHS